MFPHRRAGFFRRGMLRHMILRSLMERPMHGYELMKSLSDQLGGAYWPSAGAIYPTLQALEEEGYVSSEEKEGKRVYAITVKGMELAKKSEETFKAILEGRKAFISERRGLNRELRNLVSLITTNYRDLDKEKADTIAQVLREARKKISDIVFE
jgi:DNA-binding PadR family transcriptional regulator